ncbi:MAG: acetate--CoA ligase [Rhodospirillales bacterium]|nr:acetate--CoA ligase [Rhodospirillales bacterium]
MSFEQILGNDDLDGLPGGGLNIAHEAVDRHAKGRERDTVALRCIAKNGAVHDLTYAELGQNTDRFANVLRGLGVTKGERVFSLVGRSAELYTVALGTMKNGSIFCPLFSAFGPEPIHARLSIGGASVLVTTAALYVRKIAALRVTLPDLHHVLIIDDDAPPPGTESLPRLMRAASPDACIEATMPDDPALLHFTSGTTGAPKGAVHVHGAVVSHVLSARVALDLRPGDVYWCTADPGWVTGTSYGIIAPLVLGATVIVDEAEFDAARWYGILEAHKVNVWYTAPTAIRMLMKAGAEFAHGFDLSAVRFLASVGEPLNPEAVLWGREVLGHAFHDTWWQTETGAIMIANSADMAIKPGSMGHPLPGVTAGIVRRLQGGGVEEITTPDIVGELALRAGWPSMFRAYWGEAERYRKCFVDGWYLSGDLVRRDRDGYYWFIGRADDVIKSAGHLIGPFEVESALTEHPAVAEAGVIGKTDPVAMEVVKAFVTLKSGHAPSDALRRELLGFARQRLGAAVAPREIEFCADLPKTRSGKIMRRLLKARELGLLEGDTSSLETDG